MQVFKKGGSTGSLIFSKLGSCRFDYRFGGAWDGPGKV